MVIVAGASNLDLSEMPWRSASARMNGHVHLGVGIVGATDHGDDVALVVEGHEPRQRIVRAVERRGHRIPRRVLQVVVERRVHAQPAAVDLRVAEALVAELLVDVVAHVLGAVLRVARRAEPLLRGALQDDQAAAGSLGTHPRQRLRVRELLLVDLLRLEHRLQHGVAPERRLLLVRRGVGGLR
jgi:hypothetical protein